MRTVFLNGKEYEVMGNFEKDIASLEKFSLVNSKFKIKHFENIKVKTVFFTVPFLNVKHFDFFSKNLKKLSSKFSNINFVVISCEIPFTLELWEKLVNQDNVIAVTDYVNKNFSRDIGCLVDKIFLLSKNIFILNESFKTIYQDFVSNLHDDLNFKEIEKFLSNI